MNRSIFHSSTRMTSTRRRLNKKKNVLKFSHPLQLIVVLTSGEWHSKCFDVLERTWKIPSPSLPLTSHNATYCVFDVKDKPSRRWEVDTFYALKPMPCNIKSFSSEAEETKLKQFQYQLQQQERITNELIWLNLRIEDDSVEFSHWHSPCRRLVGCCFLFSRALCCDPFSYFLHSSSRRLTQLRSI